jgi:prevent-host-death family protein
MATWQLQTAKARLSELLRAVREDGPQTISVRGKEEYVVMRKEDVLAQTATRPQSWEDLDALAQGAGDELVLPPRDPEPARPLELGEERSEWKPED